MTTNSFDGASQAALGGAEVERRLEELLEYPFWASHYEALRGDAEALATEAGRFRAALNAGGASGCELSDVRAALLARAGYEEEIEESDVRPASAFEGAPTAVCDGWDDDWALEIARQAIRYVAQHAQGVDYEALDLSEAYPAHDDMDAAALAGDRDAYLSAARRWTRAMRRAVERVRVLGGRTG